MAGSKVIVEASAAGKVLLTGGYVVLERPNSGLVMTVSSRFHVRVKTGLGVCGICVRCPQIDAEGRYVVAWEGEGGGMSLKLVEGSSVGGFVEAALAVAVAMSPSVDVDSLDMRVDVEGDGAFYSEHGKTGLGSSAAVVTSVVAAVLQALCGKIGDGSDGGGDSRVFAAAQIAHCAAQGKIGSGFDVAAAVRGPLRYVRFPPERLKGWEVDVRVGNATVGWRLKGDTASENGDYDDLGADCRPWALPEGWDIVLGQVSSGTKTVSMVKVVEAWRQSRGGVEAKLLWTELVAANAAVEAAVAAQSMDAARVAFRRTRDALKEIGERSGAPIEPESVTPILDATSQIPGVVHAGVPGAGGFDAVCAVVSTPLTRQLIESVSPPSPSASPKTTKKKHSSHLSSSLQIGRAHV